MIRSIAKKCALFSLGSALLMTSSLWAEQPNFLIIVADDMNYDSPGFAGGGIAPDVTPNLDRLASQGYYIENGFSTVAVCQPSRQSMLTGLYPGKYGSEGFFPIGKGVETVTARLKKHGYITATLHKAHHMLPMKSFAWDYTGWQFGYRKHDGVVGRTPDFFYASICKVAEEAGKKDAPFIFVANSADPHRPFTGARNDEKKHWPKDYESIPEPSRIYSAEEVNVPAVLPDLPGVRKELAQYASSMRRLDDAVGACLKALRDSGVDNETVVVFVSDNGMEFPFGKFDCYLDSNKTPVLIRLPGGEGAGIKNPNALVSLVDITPTILELADVPPMDGLDGKSLVGLIKNSKKGKAPAFRDYIVTARHEDIYYPNYIEMRLKTNPNFVEDLKANGWVLRDDHPTPGTYSLDRNMRMIYDGRHAYIYNHFKAHGSDRVMTSPCLAFNAMRKAAKTEPEIERRVDAYMHRVPEELYDYKKDPGSHKNLIGSREHKRTAEKLRKQLHEWMKQNGDPELDDFSADAGLKR